MAEGGATEAQMRLLCLARVGRIDVFRTDARTLADDGRPEPTVVRAWREQVVDWDRGRPSARTALCR